MLGNPTAILVDVIETFDSSTLTIEFEGTHSKPIASSDISIISFLVTPEITGPSTITGNYNYGSVSIPLIPVNVIVNAASDLSLYYSGLYRARKNNS